jgi:hypothetical protein
LILPGALHRGRKRGVSQITLHRKRTAISDFRHQKPSRARDCRRSWNLDLDAVSSTWRSCP